MNEALFAPCTPGLERVLTDEVRELGFISREVSGGCEFEGPAGAYERANLQLRLATRVWLRIAQVRQAGELQNFAWAPWVPETAQLRVEATGLGADAFKRALVSRAPRGASGGPAVGVLVRVESGQATVSLETSGEPLYQRGARQEIGRAPMRETLAAGMLRLAGYRGLEPLHDVMCGSGTLLIEAAEIAHGLPAGRLRSFAFEHLPFHQPARWQGLNRAATRTAVPPIVGSDLNAGALGTARRNAKRAQVFESLELHRADATQLPVNSGAPGLVVANVPYGKRVGDPGALSALFKALGAGLRRSHPGWRYAFLTNSEPSSFGLPVDAVHPVANGGLRCQVVCGRIALK